MDYYDLMVPLQSFRAVAISAWVAASSQLAWAQVQNTVSTPAPPPVTPSVIDAELFYEIFLGELSSQSGDPGAGYAFMLEAARRSGDSRLYQRATDIALQARSGEHALAAARAWKAALPLSREANRYVLQILVALNRIQETGPLLQQELAQTPQPAKDKAIATLAQLYGRATDKALAVKVVETALQAELQRPLTASVAWATIGKLKLAASDQTGALDAAKKAHALDPASDTSAQLALMLAEKGLTEAENLLGEALAQPAASPMRMAYAKLLLGQQRYPEATKQIQAITIDEPNQAEPWLVLASLHAEADKLAAASAALAQFTAISERFPDPEVRQRALNQAYMLQAQIAEKSNDFGAAEAWLHRVADADDVVRLYSRRAQLLLRQGKDVQARALLSTLPDATPRQLHAKQLAQVQLLRDMRLFDEAFQLQSTLAANNPNDLEVLYDQAMLAERAGKLDTMEKLLRQIIEQDGEHYHAHNALGYSMADRGVQLQEAKRLIVKALEIAPKDPFVTDSLGWVEFRLGNKAEAKRLLELAYKTRPDTEIAAHLGEVLWSLDEKESALQVWKQGLQKDADNETLKSTLQRLGVKL